MSTDTFVAARDAAIATLKALVLSDERLVALWLQGSLADGSDDALSDIDAYIAVKDEAFDAVYGAHFELLRAIAPTLAWSNATTPGLAAVHALLDGPVKLDLFFERVSQIDKPKRPAIVVLADKSNCTAALTRGDPVSRVQVAFILDIMIRMQRQGALWPVRVLLRGQFATFAMMELDLINKEIALLMALQRDAKHYYTNPFSLSRTLHLEQREILETLTADAIAALAARDLIALKAVHLRVHDALTREGRAACEALGIPYPIEADADAKLRVLLDREWPAALT